MTDDISGYRKCDREPSEVLQYWAANNRSNKLVPFDSLLPSDTPLGGHRDSVSTIPRNHSGYQMTFTQRMLEVWERVSKQVVERVTGAGDSVGEDEEIPLQIATNVVPHNLKASQPAVPGAIKVTDLDSLPYQSIGKVIASTTPNFKIGTKKSEVHGWATAFYIGQECTASGQTAFKVLTAAHFSESEEYKNDYLAFVPSSNVDLSNNDVYPVRGKLVHSQYEQGKAKYDICVMYIVPKQSEAKEIITPPWKPLKLVVGDYTPSLANKWKVIGYPKVDPKILHEFAGKYVPVYGIEGYEPNTIEMRNMNFYGNHKVKTDEIGGMSGGPWIRIGTDDEVNGIQSRMRVSTKDCASPYFRADLLDALDLGYEKFPGDRLI